MTPEIDSDSGDQSRSTAPVDPEVLIDRLIAAGVLTIGDGTDADELVLTDEFVDLVRECSETVSDADAPLEDALADVVDEPWLNELLPSAEFDEGIVAEYLALVRADIDGLGHQDRIRALPLLDALRNAVADEGSPDPFVPVRGSHLPVLLQLYERAIVYTWRDDCPPCDTMRETFEEVFDQPPDDMALFSVCGPDAAELLHEQYDVVGGPTVLFVHEGTVDARLTGAHARPIVENEIRKLREL